MKKIITIKYLILSIYYCSLWVWWLHCVWLFWIWRWYEHNQALIFKFSRHTFNSKKNPYQNYRCICNALTYISKDEWSDFGLKKEILIKPLKSINIPKNQWHGLSCYQIFKRIYKHGEKCLKSCHLFAKSCPNRLVSRFWTVCKLLKFSLKWKQQYEKSSCVNLKILRY